MNSSMSTLGKTLAAAFAVAASSASAVETVWNNPGYKWTPSGDGPYYWNDAANWEKADPEASAIGVMASLVMPITLPIAPRPTPSCITSPAAPIMPKLPAPSFFIASKPTWRAVSC